MSLVPEYIGNFRHFFGDGRWREVHVWVLFDPVDCVVLSIHMGISALLSTSVGPLRQQECQSPTERAAWQFAQHYAEEGIVIEPFESETTVVPFGTPRRH